jgi:hypothetical protein
MIRGENGPLLKMACSARFGLDFQMGPVPISSPPYWPHHRPLVKLEVPDPRHSHWPQAGARRRMWRPRKPSSECRQTATTETRNQNHARFKGKTWEMIGQLWSNMVELCQNKKDGDILGLSGTLEINKVNQGETSNGEEQPNKNRKNKNHQNKNKDANPSRPHISYITWII